MPRYLTIALSILFFPLTSAHAQISIGIDLPGVSIGINQPVFPELVRVPGYPVYYAPRLNSNYFFYDGMYWVYQDDNWYASSWYNGPWSLVDPDAVPLYVLRIPVRYYRSPPRYFRGWRADAPPRWSQHWGNAWAQQRSGWDNWNHRAAPAPAPLPVYQRQYSGKRYPRAEQQQALQGQNYHYRPRDSAAHQAPVRTAPAPAQRGQPLQEGIARPQENQLTTPSLRQGAPAGAGPRGDDGRRSTAVQDQQRQAQHEQQLQQQGAAQREQQVQRQAQHEQQLRQQQQGAAQREQQQAQRQAQHEQQVQQQGAAQREQQAQRQQQGAAQREQQQAQRQAQHEQQVQQQGAAQREQQQRGAAQREQQAQRQQQDAAQREQQQVQRQQQAQHEQPKPNQNDRESRGAPQEGRRGQDREKGGERGQERDK